MSTMNSWKGSKMATKWQRFSVEPPKDFTPAMRQQLGLEVAEFVRQRSESGLDKNNKAFPKYSKAYKESLDFNNAGKTSKVDLTLSGDMLIDLDILSNRSDKIVIGYEKGTEENSKADGNVRGTYGKSSPIPGKKRDFMGITKTDYNNIVRGVRSRYGEDLEDGTDTVAALALARMLDRRKD